MKCCRCRCHPRPRPGPGPGRFPCLSCLSWPALFIYSPHMVHILWIRLVFALISNCFCLFSSSCGAFDLWLWCFGLALGFLFRHFEIHAPGEIGLMTMTLLWCQCLTWDILIHILDRSGSLPCFMALFYLVPIGIKSFITNANREMHVRDRRKHLRSQPNEQTWLNSSVCIK